MSGPDPAVDYVDLSLPLWFVIDLEVAKSHGQSFAVHILREEGGAADLPLFTNETVAEGYIVARSLAGHAAASVETVVDLRIMLELFRTRGGKYVRIDDPTGDTPGIFCPTLDSFFTLLP